VRATAAEMPEPKPATTMVCAMCALLLLQVRRAVFQEEAGLCVMRNDPKPQIGSWFARTRVTLFARRKEPTFR
jgi:hypothetical protein